LALFRTYERFLLHMRPTTVRFVYSWAVCHDQSTTESVFYILHSHAGSFLFFIHMRGKCVRCVQCIYMLFASSPHVLLLIYSFLDGYCSTVQGLLDWFEVDLRFTELLFIQIDFCVLCVFVLYSRVSLCSCPFSDILHCLPRAVGVPLESCPPPDIFFIYMRGGGK